MLEIVLVIVTIGLLAMGMLSYFRDDENTTKYKAEACLNGIQSKVTNYVNAALTSKKIGEDTEQYIIRFDREESNSMFLEQEPRDEDMSEKIDFSEVCGNKGFSFDLSFSGTSFDTIIMNKGFRQLHANQPHSFRLEDDWEWTIFTGEVKINLCRNDYCEKEFARRIIDARTQTIGFQYCLFYKEDDLNTCRQRQN